MKIMKKNNFVKPFDFLLFSSFLYSIAATLDLGTLERENLLLLLDVYRLKEGKKDILLELHYLTSL